MDEESEKLAKKRGYVIQEIIDTEKSYVDKLQAVIDIFIDPMRKQNILDADDIRGQFGYWEVMTGIHKEMLAVMLSEKEQGTLKMGLLFFKYSHYFKVYKDYLVNFELALTRRGVLMTSNRRFMQNVEEALKDSRCYGLGIESLLIGPVQRIPRYRLLFSELLKCTPPSHEEHAAIVSALDKVSELASENNEAIRNRENKEQIMSVMMNIDPRTRINLLDEPSRMLLRSGILQRQCRRVVKEFMFWLFSDKLLYGETIPGLGTYWLHREIQLVACRVSDGSKSSIERPDCAITVESPAKSFIIWTKTPEDKVSWLADITKSMDALRQKIKSETGRIAPIWMPDAKSTNCVLCENPFGIFNRRHHCRNCGSVVCGNCSKNRFKIEHVDPRNPVRVCTDCFDELTMVCPTNKEVNPHTAVSRTIRRKSAILQNNDLAFHNAPVLEWSAALLDDDNDGSENRHVDGQGEELSVNSGRMTIIDFDRYREEIDSVRHMRSLSTFENPVVVSMRRKSQLSIPQMPPESAITASSASANESQSQVGNGEDTGVALLDPKDLSSQMGSIAILGPGASAETATAIEVLSDYSSEDSDYETVSTREPSDGLEGSGSPDPRATKSPRKSRRSRLTTQLSIGDGDPIPPESPARDPRRSQIFLPTVPTVDTVSEASVASPISTVPAVPPPKPPKRTSITRNSIAPVSTPSSPDQPTA